VHDVVVHGMAALTEEMGVRWLKEECEGSGPWLGQKGWAKRAGQNMLLGQASAGSSFQWNMLSLQGHRLDLERGRTLLGGPIGERGGPMRGWQSRPVWRGRWVVRRPGRRRR
jgi:hypothetical protein